MFGYAQKNIANNKGITLVALIITIIVLIILAVISINTIFKLNIISFTENSAINYANAQKQEQDQMDYLAKLLENTTSKIIELGEGEGILQISPDGNTKYAKEHIVKITKQSNTIVKYQWIKDGEEPKENEYIEITNDEETITKKENSGVWRICLLIEKTDGTTKTEISKPFYFDNIAPIVELSTEPLTTSSFSITATAKENESKIEEYKFYIDGKLVHTEPTNEGSATYIANNIETGTKECSVEVIDSAENPGENKITARTKYYRWEKWNIERIYTLSSTLSGTGQYYFSKNYDIYKRDSITGSSWKLNLVCAQVSWRDLNKYEGCFTMADNGQEVLHMIKITQTNPNNKCINVNTYKASQLTTTQKKGNVMQGYVNSTNSNAYTDEAITGSF